jgi:hypothetical protein
MDEHLRETDTDLTETTVRTYVYSSYRSLQHL